MAKAKFSPTYFRLRQLLVETRKKAGLSQTQVAERLGKPQSYVQKIEVGERRLDVIEYADLAQAMGIDPVRLLKKILAR